MNRIDNGQLFAILLLSGFWGIICMPSVQGSGQFAGILIAGALEVLLCLPLLALPEGSIPALLQRRKILGILYAGFFLLWGARSLTELQAAAPQQLLQVPGKTVGLVLMMLTCLAASTAGIKAAARCAPLLLGALCCTLLVLLAGAWRRIDLNRVTFQLHGVTGGFRSFLTLSGELAAASVIRVRGNVRKSLFQYLAVKTLLCLLLVFLFLTAGGRLTSSAEYPFFTLAALSQPLQEQRADALYILIFVMLSILHITLQTGVASHVLEMLFPKLKGTAPVTLGGMLLLAWMLPESILQLAEACMIPVMVFAVPLGLWIAQSARKEAAA